MLGLPHSLSPSGECFMVNKVAKGNKLELQIKKILEKKGFIVYKPTRTKFTTQKDVWNLFDLLAWHPELQQLIFLQITNRSYLNDKVKIIKEFAPQEIFAGVFSRIKQIVTFYGKIEGMKDCDINLKVDLNFKKNNGRRDSRRRRAGRRRV